MAKSKKTIAKSRAPGAGLGDTELILLARGGQHQGRLIDAPDSMKAATRQRAAANLIKRGLAEERAAGPDEPSWREHEGERIALGITAAGLAAIGIEHDAAPGHEAGDEGGRLGPASDPTHPRPGSKGALVVSLLSRNEGASIEELIAETGWLPHTTRAALTGLRKRGFAIDRSSDEGESRYRIPAPERKTTRRGRKTRASETQAAA